MKNLFFFVLSLSLASSAFAQKPATGQTSGRKIISSTSKALKGLSVFGGYSFADTMDYEASGAGMNGSGTFGTDKAFNLGAQYTVYTLDNGIAFDVGGTYEIGKNLNNQKENGNTVSFDNGKPEAQFWTMFGNASIYFTDKFGVFAGPNYNIPTISKIPNASSSNWKGEFGFQAGATFQPHRNFAIDGQYRVLNFSGSVSQKDQLGNTVTRNFDKVKMSGFGLSGRYLF